MTKTKFAGWMAVGLAYAALAGAEQYDRPYDQPYDQSGYGASTLDERVARLEKRLSGETLMEMANRIEKLQGEVLRLRGTVEELGHELDKAKRQQREMYGDLDQRLKAAAAPPPPPVAAAPSVAPSPADATPPAPDPGAAAPAVSVPTPSAPAAAPPPPPPAPVVDPAVRQAAYQKAFNTLKEGKYTEAIRDFKGYVANYPSGDNTDSAYYWLAEAYYVNRDFNSARDTFRRLIRDFPKSAKVSDAHLKLGFIEYENAQYGAAKELLNGVIKNYPDSSAAKMAEKRLERMRQEKH